MNIFVILISALLIIIVLLRRRVPIGPAILFGQLPPRSRIICGTPG